ncbi:MAG: protoheme IX farnesyltransferase [Anaerolineaceae bacterium]|nr:protoheme IX farnesyltransferase [Anaerolineaceae bacterium]
MKYITNIHTKVKLYWPLFKSLQTGLLLLTGLAGYMSTRCPVNNWQTLLALTGSLILAISGSTILNMWYDRDIDAAMERTRKRPLPSGRVSPRDALRLGLLFATVGIVWAMALDALYGLIVFAGLFFDVVIYTIWLKRRTPWSIIWGGVSGGMPALAGRALGTGQIEWVGLALALAVLFWIPTHIMTFSLRYREDYRQASVPTFPAAYGERVTRIIIAISSVLAALMMVAAAYGIGLTIGYLRLMAVLSVGLLLLAVRSSTQPSDKLNFGLFKYASLYMLSVMLLFIFV